MPAQAHLYIHIPFCTSRCSYCDFTSSIYNADIADAYLHALEAEFKSRAAHAAPQTIYIGGGTPSSLTPAQLDHLLCMIESLDLSQLEECSIEANPSSLTMEKLLRLYESPVRRVSLGVQSFNQDGLEVLGRIHTGKQARAAIARLRETGFEEISLDMIYGWPEQSLRDWYGDLQKVIELDVPHCSCYCLNYPDGTRLRELLESGMVEALHESTERRLFDLTQSTLEEAGLARYEISNFATEGHACKHNIQYWTGGAYLGFGAGAHSYQDGVRFGNMDSVQSYIDAVQENGSAVSMTDELAPDSRARECAAIWLRLREGIDEAAFRRRTGYDLALLLAQDLPPLLEGGWLAWSADGRYLFLTEKAIPLADSVLAELIE